MFGYVAAPVQLLSEQEAVRYRQVYCGLCRTLGKRFGAAARLSLNYDLTFLALLLQSLYEPEEESGEGRCAPHPLEARNWSASAVTDYAADMTVALTYHKCLDDWADDRSLKARLYAACLEPGYGQVKERWPRQCLQIELCLKEYTRMEHEKSSGGELCACFGRLMSELFVWREDEWSFALRALGSSLGQWICLMDGVMDAQKDRRTGAYNVAVSLGLTEQSAESMLKILCGHVTDIFEKLPLEQDLNLLRSILYAGIWQQYRAAQAKKNGIEKAQMKDTKIPTEGDGNGSGSI